MSMMNAFMSGESTKDLTPFVSHKGGTIDYARYVITPYTGSKSSTGIEANATHVFWGMIHFSDAVNYNSRIVITTPESYKIVAGVQIYLPSLSTGSNSQVNQKWEIDNARATLTNTSYAFKGFIFPSFLCYK